MKSATLQSQENKTTIDLLPIVKELKQQGFEVEERRDFIDLLSKKTKKSVSGILDIKWRDSKTIHFYGSEKIDLSSCNTSECLEVWDAAKKLAYYLESCLENIEFTQILHEQNNSDGRNFTRLNLLNEIKTTGVGKINFWDEPYKYDVYFTDEQNDWNIARLDVNLPIKWPNQRITFQASLKQHNNIHKANMDILALKNVLENMNGAALIQANLENVIRKYTDPMTGLYNGMYVEETLRNPDHGYSLVFIDISRFKEINDTNWQKTWDEAIKKVADVIKWSCRIQDKVCRLGWDEFAILFPNDQKDEIQNLINRLEQKDISVKNQDNKDVEINLKFWYAVNHDGKQNHIDLLTTANEMLSQNKDKKWAAYRMISMFLGFDKETKAYSLWEMMSNPETLNYFSNVLLTPPISKNFLQEVGKIFDSFLLGNLDGIDPESVKVLEEFTQRYDMKLQAA